MKAYLDDVVLVEGVETLAGAVDAARLATNRAGRVVIGATLDGRSLSDEELLAEAGPVGREVRFTSGSRAMVGSSALMGGVDAVRRASQRQLEAAETIQRGQPGEAMDAIQQCLELWASARDALDGTATLMCLDLKSESPDGLSVAMAVRDLAECLGQLRDSLSIEDWSSVSDVLAYDLSAAADQWERMLVAMSDRVSRVQ